MRFGFILLLVALLLGCGGGGGDGQLYQYTQPEQTSDGWETAGLADVGLDEQNLEAMVNTLAGRGHDVNSVLIIKDGYLVFEHYLSGPGYCYSCPNFQDAIVDWDMHTRHHIASVTKSVTSTLIGIAIDEGYISDIDDRMFDYLPDYLDLLNGQNEAITLEHLLMMSAGFDWNEYLVSLADPSNDIVVMTRSSEPIRYVLSKPIVFQPGMGFDYGGGVSNLLGQVLREATGKSVTEYANEVLFQPLGIDHVEFRRFPNAPNDMDYVSGSLYLTPREMAKLGWLLVNNGQWQGQQIVSSEWAESATRSHVATNWPVYDGYGFQWWIHTLRGGSLAVEAFIGRGWGGQAIVGIPSLNMVAVITGADYVKAYEMDPKMLMERFILFAVQ